MLVESELLIETKHHSRNIAFFDYVLPKFQSKLGGIVNACNRNNNIIILRYVSGLLNSVKALD
jgi:hypothetical protein